MGKSGWAKMGKRLQQDSMSNMQFKKGREKFVILKDSPLGAIINLCHFQIA